MNSDCKDINNVEDLVRQAKKAGKGWIMAGTGKNSVDSQLNFLTLLMDSHMKDVPHKGAVRLPRSWQETTLTQQRTTRPNIWGFETGKTKPLACFAPERIGLFNDAPTFQELGRDFLHSMRRTVIGAPGMSAETKKYHQELFTKVFNSREW